MSKNASDADERGLAGLERELTALRQSPEFRGPVEPIDDLEHSHNHFALIYETKAERFGAVVPFVREGLDRGEQCIYVVEDDPSGAIAALEDGGIDVDAARDRGALQFVSARETYLGREQFDPDAILSYYADVIERAQESFDGLRVTAGTGWIEEISIDVFMEYEGRTNELFEEYDVRALCHYDRTELPTDVIRDVIRTHPHLIYEDTVCHNFYYTPPEELFSGTDPDDEVDRMLGTVRDRARAKSEVADHRQFLRKLNEITGSPDMSFEEKLQSLFELGCEWFDLDLGGLNKVDPEADHFEAEYISHDHPLLEPGVELPLSETYCQAAAGIKAAASVENPEEQGFSDIAVYDEYGTEAYLGTYVPIEGGPDRTFGFLGDEPREEPFSREDKTCLELMGQWVQYELEQRQYRNELEETVQRLQKSNERLKQFAYAASHDLQEPLRMVSSYLQLLESEHAEDLDAEALECIDFAVDGADRMREMVQDLLAYSRVEQSDRDFEPVDCDTVIDRAVEDLRVSIEERDATITRESLPTVTGDAEQLEQLFRNLLSNAVKYGGEKPTVRVGARQRDTEWEFTVADDGIGIDPAKVDQIFDVFKRLHHDDEHSGTGIGLALCQEIVANHGGDVWAESEPGEGTTIYVTLPRRTDA